MSHTHRPHGSWIITVIATLTLGLAHAERAGAQTLDDAALAQLHTGNNIKVTSSSTSTRGALATATPSDVTLLVHGTLTTFHVASLSAITMRYRDPVGDGAKRGALAGLELGVVLGLVGALSDCGESHSLIDFCSPLAAALLSGYFGGIGAGIGAAVGVTADAIMPSTREIWRAPRGRATVGLAPVIRTTAAGAAVTVAW